ncbi:MAG: hypothetical protein LBS85_04605 [Clostridiales Family XIII bacterium]|jgi:YegS/Rv2252/BmrU family lipid kinase|nr:hypothetical protein [Clostridiales Family XIII bacterium]
MKHCFVLNPAAGNGKAQVALLPRILAAVKEAGVDYEIHRTVNTGDACLRVWAHCEREPQVRKRFYACGGDGTLSEALNGLYGFENAELASVPIGTGNDFVRNFGGKEGFLDIAAQIAGAAVPIDVMRYEISAGEDAGGLAAQGYAINMFNMGFDADVVARTARLKKNPLLNGTAAYAAGVATELIRLRAIRARISIDGGEAIDTDILLSGVANGRYSGGGFDGIPSARVNDGLLDVAVITPLSRREFIQLIGKYHDGTHVDDPRMQSYMSLRRCREALYTPAGGMTLSIDGEARRVSAPVRFSVASERVSFALPRGVKLAAE